MEEAFELGSYLPLSYQSEAERDYIAFLWDAFRTNYEHDKYQFAFLAYHMLTMSFVYFNIWQIRQNRKDDFLKATCGFTKENEDTVTSATSPFTFSEIGESVILRFLKLIGCDNGKIGTYAKLVKDRNASAHPSGVIHYSTQKALDQKIAQTLRVVAEIEKHSKDVIEECYQRFLLESHDPEEREYPDPADQIREVLVHANYFSQKDVEICVAYDLKALRDHANYTAIEALHWALHAQHAEDE
jgi:hypothetical protein